MAGKRSVDETKKFKQRVIETYVDAMGDLGKIAKTLGIGLRTIYYWKEHDSDFADNLNEQESELTERAKAILYEMVIDKKNMTAIIFWLKNKTKEFADYKDIRVPGPIKIIHEFVGKTTKELEYFAEHGDWPKRTKSG
jgi:hypothetical protein